jgi:hypothetical protein
VADGTGWRAPGAPVHDAPMAGRFLALCGWLADLFVRPFRGTPLRRLGRAPAAVVGILLLALAAAPIVVPLLEPEPQTVGVQEIFDGAVTGPDGWVRLRGRIVPLAEPPVGERDGPFALLVDADRPLRAIVVVTDEAATESTVITGRLEPDEVELTEPLPIEATVAGTPPRVVPDRVLVADPTPHPERSVWWPLAIPPAVLGILVLVGARSGYPVFRSSVEVDVLSSPLRPGERIPAAFGGRLGSNLRDLADPGGALLVVRAGSQGNVLAAQPLADDPASGPAPPPVLIGGGWTSGRLGYVHTVRESVPALVIRSELVDATFLFARVAERDRVAALIAIER